MVSEICAIFDQIFDFFKEEPTISALEPFGITGKTY